MRLLVRADASRQMGTGHVMRWLALDCYQFIEYYQRKIEDAGLNLLFVDDYGYVASYCADFVLNQNSYAHEGLYSDRDLHIKFLLGTRYALLRREFQEWQNRAKETQRLPRRFW